MKRLCLLSVLLTLSCSKSHQFKLIVNPEIILKTVSQLEADGVDIRGVDWSTGTITFRGGDTESLGQYGKVVEEGEAPAAPDSQYYTSEKLETKLRELTSAYPDLAQMSFIGESVERRLIWAVKISSTQHMVEARPVILFNAMHHAREVMTTEVAVDIIEQLLTKYASDPEVKSWVDKNEIWVVPMINPDGNNKVWNNNSMWRKNARGNYGVDLNRNYPYKWSQCNGSSGSQSSETYRGPSAASEPETQAMMQLVANIKPIINVSFHSYSELVIYPYGCQGQHMDTPRREVVEGIGKELASKLVKDNGSGSYEYGTAWELLYSVDGGDTDWMHNAKGVIPFVIEVSSAAQGFQPSYYKWRDSTVERLRPGWQFLLGKLQSSGVRVSVPENSYVVVLPADRSYSVKYSPSNGHAHALLNPGKYTVEVFTNGIKTSSKNIDILDSVVHL